MKVDQVAKPLSKLTGVKESEVKNFLLFLLSGCIGTLVFYGMYELLQGAFKELSLKTTLSWTTSYTLSIVLQHYLHANLVYKNWNQLRPFFSERYNKSLLLTYAAYLISMGVSSALSLVFDLVHLDHRLAFLLNLGLTGVLNYLTVSKAMKQS